MSDWIMSIKQLANHQLIPVHSKWPDYREEIEREWKWREGLDFPYRLTREGILHMEQHADRVPPRIIKQASDIREQQSEEWRLSVIEQLALIRNHNRSVYTKMSNAQLKGELKREYE